MNKQTKQALHMPVAPSLAIVETAPAELADTASTEALTPANSDTLPLIDAHLLEEPAAPSALPTVATPTIAPAKTGKRGGVVAIKAEIIGAASDACGRGLRLTFLHGEVLTVYPRIQLSTEIREMAELHGLKQKLVDAAAIANDKSNTIVAKFDAVKVVYDRIMREDGTWNQGAGESAADTGGLLLLAMMELKPKSSRETIEKFLGSKTKEELKGLRLDKRVAPVIARLQQERLKITENDSLSDFLDSDEE